MSQSKELTVVPEYRGEREQEEVTVSMPAGAWRVLLFAAIQQIGHDEQQSAVLQMLGLAEKDPDIVAHDKRLQRTIGYALDTVTAAAEAADVPRFRDGNEQVGRYMAPGFMAYLEEARAQGLLAPDAILAEFSLEAIDAVNERRKAINERQREGANKQGWEEAAAQASAELAKATGVKFH